MEEWSKDWTPEKQKIYKETKEKKYGKEYVKIQTMKKFMDREVFDTYEEAIESAIIDYINHN
jgi:hypothetical protein